jgi:hypothetical protein
VPRFVTSSLNRLEQSPGSKDDAVERQVGYLPREHTFGQACTEYYQIIFFGHFFHGKRCAGVTRQCWWSATKGGEAVKARHQRLSVLDKDDRRSREAYMGCVLAFDEVVR